MVERISRYILPSPNSLKGKGITFPHSRLTGGKGNGLYFLNTLPGIAVPNFIVLSSALFKVMVKGNARLSHHLTTLNKLSLIWLRAKLKGVETGSDHVNDIAEKLRELTLKLSFTKSQVAELEAALIAEFSYGNLPRFSARSSVVGEDSVFASFSGCYETARDIPFSELPTSIINVWASYFDLKAVAARNEASALYILMNILKRGIAPRRATDEFIRRNFIYSPLETPMAVIIQKWIRSSAAGTCTSINPADHRNGTYVVAAEVGETVVSGESASDKYFITSPDAIEYAENNRGLISQDNLLALFEQSQRISSYSRKEYRSPHLDNEFAIDLDGQLFWLQSRPLILGRPATIKLIDPPSPIYSGGILAAAGITTGNIRIGSTTNEKDAIAFRRTLQKGDIVVVDKFHADWADLIYLIGGVITELGETTSHAANICREVGVPCLVGAAGARETLSPHDRTTATLFANETMVFPGTARYNLVERDKMTPCAGAVQNRQVKTDSCDYADPKTGRKYFGKPRFPLVGLQYECYLDAMHLMNTMIKKLFDFSAINFKIIDTPNGKHIYAPSDELSALAEASKTTPLKVLTRYINERKRAVREWYAFTKAMEIKPDDLKRFFYLYGRAVSYFHLRGTVMIGLLRERVELLSKYGFSDGEYNDFCWALFQPRTEAQRKLADKVRLLQRIKRNILFQSAFESYSHDHNHLTALAEEILNTLEYSANHLFQSVKKYAKSYLIIATEDLRVSERTLYLQVIEDLIASMDKDETILLVGPPRISFREIESILNRVPEEERGYFICFSRFLVEHNTLRQEDEHHLQPRIQWFFLDKLSAFAIKNNKSLEALLKMSCKDLEALVEE